MSDYASLFNEEYYSRYREESSVYKSFSWLIINPIIGCDIGCKYCFRHKWNAPDQVTRIFDDEKAVIDLIKNKNFIPNYTPISANISSTDPLHRLVKPSTFAILRSLNEKGYRNPFGIISKCSLTESDIDFIKSLDNIQPLLLLCFSDMPEYIEPLNRETRIESIKKSSSANIPVILYYRPIVKEWNDSPSSIRKVLSIGERYCKSIVIGGIRLSKEIKDNLDLSKISVPYSIETFSKKIFPNDLERKIIDTYFELNLQIPLFKHTSCAVSHYQNVANYDCIFSNPAENCIITCPTEQMEICKSSLGELHG